MAFFGMISIFYSFDTIPEYDEFKEIERRRRSLEKGTMYYTLVMCIGLAVYALFSTTDVWLGSIVLFVVLIWGSEAMKRKTR